MEIKLDITNPEIGEAWKEQAKRLLKNWIESLAYGVDIKSVQEIVFTNSIKQRQSLYEEVGYRTIFTINDATLMSKDTKRHDHVIVIPLAIVNMAFYQKNHRPMDQTLLSLLHKVNETNVHY